MSSPAVPSLAAFSPSCCQCAPVLKCLGKIPSGHVFMRQPISTKWPHNLLMAPRMQNEASKRQTSPDCWFQTHSLLSALQKRWLLYAFVYRCLIVRGLEQHSALATDIKQWKLFYTNHTVLHYSHAVKGWVQPKMERLTLMPMIGYVNFSIFIKHLWSFTGKQWCDILQSSWSWWG